MNFYGIKYLESQSSLNDYIKYSIIFGALIFLIIVFSLYMRHRIQTKYRDLSIITLLLLLFLLGVQYSDYTQNRNMTSQSSLMVNFVKQIAAERDISTDDVLVNSTQLTDGTIVKLNSIYYKIHLSADQSSYTLEKTYLLNPSIKINE